MRRKLALPIAMLFLAALPASAQQILPASAAGWTNTGAPMVHLAPAPQQVLAEYGLVSQESGHFQRGQESFNIYVFKMKDTSGAYGLYSFMRTADMRRADFTDHSSISHSRALVME